MSTNDFDVVTDGATRRAEDVARPEAAARRSVQEVIRAERRRLADIQARCDAARDRLFGRPAFTILPREE